MPGISITVDSSGALAKIAEMKAFGKAARAQMNQWGAATIQHILAADIPKTHPSEQLFRNLNFKQYGSDDDPSIMIGTGPDCGGRTSVKYAKIQDEGGTIRAKKKYLTIPLDKTKGRIRNYPDGFFITSKSGNLLFAVSKWKKQRGGANYWRTGKLRLLFLLKPEVTLPGTGWFTKPFDFMRRDLNARMEPTSLLRTAQRLTGKAG